MWSCDHTGIKAFWLWHQCQRGRIVPSSIIHNIYIIYRQPFLYLANCLYSHLKPAGIYSDNELQMVIVWIMVMTKSLTIMSGEHGNCMTFNRSISSELPLRKLSTGLSVHHDGGGCVKADERSMIGRDCHCLAYPSLMYDNVTFGIPPVHWAEQAWLWSTLWHSVRDSHEPPKQIQSALL